MNERACVTFVLINFPVFFIFISLTMLCGAGAGAGADFAASNLLWSPVNGILLG